MSTAESAGAGGAEGSPAVRRAARAARRAIAAAAVASAAVACSGAAKRESSALLDAVDRYRRADTASKPARREAVAGVGCSAVPVCDAKRVCLAAIDPTTRALQIKDEVASRVADIQQKRLDPASPEARALPGKLDEAARLLQAGREKMSECERRLADLRVEYGG